MAGRSLRRPSPCGSPARRPTSGGAATRMAGSAGLEDRSSRPRRCPTKTPAQVERRVVELAPAPPGQRGPTGRAGRGAGLDGAPVLGRHGVSRLSDLERRTGRVVRRIETSHARRAGPRRREEAGQDPQGRRLAGARPMAGAARTAAVGRPRLGYAYIHSAIDAYSPPGLLRGPRRRAGGHRHRLLAAGHGLLRRATASPSSGS